MASDHVLERRSSKSGLLRKQSEIEETDEVDTSPGSDQSDATITAVAEVTGATPGGGSPDSVFPEDKKKIDEQANAKHLPVHQKVKQLTRCQALCDDTSPPPEQLTTSSSESSCVSQTSSQGQLEKDGSQCSEAGTSSSLSRDSSVDTPYKDSTGIDLEEFIRRTLNKTPKDKNMLLKLETDLNNFIREPKHHYLKFPQMSSYDRMLVHRVAAFFGLDHNVDQTGKCVIVNKTANTRIPYFCFQENVEANDSQQKKQILKRGGLSLDDKESRSKSSGKLNMHDKRAQSLEERKQRYDEARTRIFKKEEMQYHENVTGIICKPSRPSSLGNGREDQPWSSTDSSGYGTDGSSKSRMMGPKAHSFGGTSSHTHHPINPYKGSSLSKADSISSGASSSLSSPMARPFLPPSTPPGIHSDNSSLSRSSSTGPIQSPHPVLAAGIVPGQGQQIFWVASDVRSIPVGSTVISPQTGKPFPNANANGTEYRHNPSQIPPWPTTSVYGQVSGPRGLFQAPQYATEVVPAGQDQSNQDLLNQFTMMLTQQQQLQQQQQQQPQPAVENSNPVQSSTSQISLRGQNPVQPSTMYPGQYYSNPQSVGGQPIRYIYPVNIPHPGAGSQGSVSIETQVPIPGQTQMFPGSGGQFTTQTPQPFVPFPGYHTVSFQGNSGQNPEGFQSATYQQSSFPVTPSDSTSVTEFTSPTYPVPYCQGGVGQTQNTIFYTVPTSGTPQMGFSYTGQGPFHSTTTPTQGGAPTTPNPTPTATPVINVATATPAINVAQPVTFGQPSGGPQAGTTRYIQYSYPQFQNQQRAQSPQIVQFPTVQSHPHTPAQTFPIYRPNMQMNMQISHGSAYSQGSALISGQQTQPFSIETQVPKLDSGDCKDVGLTWTTFGSPLVTGTSRPAAQMFQAPNQITDVRFIGQPAFRPALQVPQLHIVPVQTHRMGGTQSAQPAKSQKERNRHLKSSSKEDSHNTSQGSDSSDLTQSRTHILEVYDLPSHLKRTDAESLLQDLIASGAKIEFVKQEQNQDDKNISSISDYKQIMAVFPDNNVASQILQSHSNNKSYKLRSTNLGTENIGIVG